MIQTAQNCVENFIMDYFNKKNIKAIKPKKEYIELIYMKEGKSRRAFLYRNRHS